MALAALGSLSPDARGLLLGLLLTLAAAAFGWLIGRLLGAPFERWTGRAAPNLVGGLAGRFCAITRYAAAAVLLAAFTGLPAPGASGDLVLAVALGLAFALLLFELLRAAGLRFGAALLASALLFAAIVAGRLGGLEPLSAGLDRAALVVGKRRISLLDLLGALAVFALLFAAARLAMRLVARWVAGIEALDLSQRVLFQKLGQLAIVALAFFIGIDLLGIDLTALAVFSGAFGLAVGFGLQKTFGNLIAGLILLMDRSIKPGDIIAIEDTFGWVNKIGVRYVSLLTRDGKEHLIPNEKLMTEPVENWSYSSKDVRLHLKVGVAHSSDIHLARRLLLQAAEDVPRVLPEPAPVCWLTGFTPNAIEHELRIWINDPENGVTNVGSEVLTRVWDLFREHGITLPFQQHDVYLHGRTPN